jgi:uncharacterized protein (DUF1697 family)
MKKKAAKKKRAARTAPSVRDSSASVRDSSRRYVAFLRGVSPMNCKMAELKRALEAGGFADVKTVLSSGNVVFSAPKATTRAIEKKVEAAISKGLGRPFSVLVRSVEALRELLASDPYESFELPPEAKRVVTFLPEPPSSAPTLPIEMDGAKMLALAGSEVFSAYVPGPRGPVFMVLIEKTFGKGVTTRTWGTVEKVTR